MTHRARGLDGKLLRYATLQAETGHSPLAV